MSRTLLILATHFIDENVILEYRKMKTTPNVDALLMINNTECKFEIHSRVEDKIFFNIKAKCFFFDEKLSDEMHLPYLLEGNKKIFAKTALHNGDYKFYYVRKFFPDYDFYWMIEYDVFCNGETYSGFLGKFADNRADLLIQELKKSDKVNNHGYFQAIDWAYEESKNICTGLFAAVRLSARAIDFLYRKRLEQGNIFLSDSLNAKQWIFCEVFVPTELMRGGFTCENLDEPRVRFLPPIYLNDTRIFLRPDNHLYHPVKSVRPQIEKMNALYNNLFFNFRKVFLLQLSEILHEIPALKNLPFQVDENFDSLVIKLRGNNLRCETWFLTESYYGSLVQIYVAVIFEGEYLEYFKAVKKYLDFSQMQSVKILQSSKGEMLACSIETFDNVSQTADVIKILVEMAFTIFKEKL